jgi:hypothetical protein
MCIDYSQCIDYLHVHKLIESYYPKGTFETANPRTLDGQAFGGV